MKEIDPELVFKRTTADPEFKPSGAECPTCFLDTDCYGCHWHCLNPAVTMRERLAECDSLANALELRDLPATANRIREIADELRIKLTSIENRALDLVILRRHPGKSVIWGRKDSPSLKQP